MVLGLYQFVFKPDLTFGNSVTVANRAEMESLDAAAVNTKYQGTYRADFVAPVLRATALRTCMGIHVLIVA